MTTLALPMTHDEFRALPEPEDGATLELIDGEVCRMSGGNSLHGLVIGRLMRRLGAFLDKHPLGELVNSANFEFTLERDWAPVPDLAFISSGRFSQLYQESRPYKGSPDLAVEVTSPSNSHREISGKTHAYLRSGSKRVWVVDPEISVIIVTRADWTARTFHFGDTLTSDDAGFEVDGFELPLADLFAR